MIFTEVKRPIPKAKFSRNGMEDKSRKGDRGSGAMRSP